MKKVGYLICSVSLLVALSACGVGNVGGAPSGTAASSAVSSAVSPADYEGSLSGLQKYMVAAAGFSGTPEAMRADLIGAKSGVRYQFGHDGNKNVTAELYEYDPSALNETAKKFVADAKKSGEITVLGEKTSASLSDNGKYMMLFRNTSTDDKNKAYDDQVKKLFSEFKK